MNKIIEFKDVSFCYRDNTIFENLNFTVEAGDFTALIGSNGAGKSTLLKLILGELSPCQGKVEITGVEPKSFRDWPTIGYIPQNCTASLQHFPATVEEIITANLYSQMSFFDFLKKQHKEKVQKALAQVGMEEFQHHSISELSGGQQQRVMVARALVTHPQVLILDEPTTGVDVQSAQYLYELLSQLNQEEKTTIFIVSHDISRLAKYTSQVYCLDEGSLVYLDSDQLEEELLHRHKHPECNHEMGCNHGIV